MELLKPQIDCEFIINQRLEIIFMTYYTLLYRYVFTWYTNYNNLEINVILLVYYYKKVVTKQYYHFKRITIYNNVVN